jgi:hypothetical protein
MDVDDITEADPVATVRIDAADDERQLARFAGMCVVAMLRATRKAEEFTEPFATVGSTTCKDLLNRVAVPDPTQYSIAEGWRPEDVTAVVGHEMFMAEEGTGNLSVETMLTIAFPRVDSGESRKGKSGDFAPSFMKEGKAAPGCGCDHATR